MKFTSTSITTLLLMLGATTVAASPAVDSNSCKKLRGANKQFVLVIKKGQNLSQALIQCANDARLTGASFTGIGAIKNPTLDYYNVHTKKYQAKTLHGVYEMVSLNGNISRLDGKRVAHMHAALSNNQLHVRGGHLNNAEVAVTAEITVTPFKGHIIKKLDEETGIHAISTQG